MGLGLTALQKQLVGFVGTGLFLASYQCKNNRHLFMLQAISYFFYMAHFFLLGALTGCLSLGVNLLRSVFLSTKWKWANSKYACIGLCVLQVIVSLMTWEGWISILPCIGNIAPTIGGYTRNPQKIRIAGMFVNSPLWIIYSIFVGSWVGVTDELVNELSGAISIYRYGWKGLDEIQE